MAGITGIPLAIAAEQILDGSVTQRGVLGPESVIDPIAMFSALAPHCEVPGAVWTDVVRLEIA
jgi:saccharopine dehydrogenase-like NADP-dependent oxidoreductase